MKRERIGRIDAAIQRALATIISREIKDPRVAFTTVTRVEVTQELDKAKVYVSIIGDRHQAFQTMEALERASGFLRGELGRAVDLRHTPELVFVEDRSTEKAIAVNATLAKLNAQRAQTPPGSLDSATSLPLTDVETIAEPMAQSVDKEH